ncbi:MAG TPA: C25 family peptidase propeptide domain-containing protein, partial [Candidatus Krumholzibacteria bacterium]
MNDPLIKLATPGRHALRRILPAVLIGLAAAAPARPAPAVAPVAQVQREEPGRVVFRVSVPDPTLQPGAVIANTERIKLDGYDRLGDPGAPPTFSRVFFVGLPPEGNYSLTYRIVATKPLGSHRLEPMATPVGIVDEDLGASLSERVIWNEDVFLAYRDPAPVVAGEVVFIRHQRALPLSIHPLAYDPVSGSLSVVKEIEVEVRFAAPRAADAAPVAPERHWNDFFGRLLVNAGQARQWSPAGVVARERMGAGTTRVAPGAVKIRVYDTGIHGVRASRAIASGFPSGQSVDQLRLFRRLYDDVTLSPSETDVV